MLIITTITWFQLYYLANFNWGFRLKFK